MRPGKFITLEGGEGLGKSTNIHFIKGFLEDNGLSVRVTREPGGTPLAEQIRLLLLEERSESVAEQTELLLMFSARAQHLKEVIYPALAQGQWVISDRFTDATYAYQGGGREIDVSLIQQLETWVQGTFRPDLTLLLDAPINIGMSRVKERVISDRFEQEQVSFFERVRQAYLLQAQKNPNRIQIINANQSLPAVQSDMVAHLLSLLKK
ncbi:MAG TPA: dTMP kinase [Methylococcaceae bacterium]|jgi:dTMP kinase|nr:dTMP kinase [Methylococcaceae bacterium]HIN69012.1 dTMP kinase [Methylococcales bacterium]HIA44912.1 dTMP kinase [Methylococcaceae bacterium]HIB63399.1 dTMP kinase [Methylococcaceae bacterium]HIO13194.1 dTMP kinase [Methylococcales bacterium]